MREGWLAVEGPGLHVRLQAQHHGAPASITKPSSLLPPPPLSPCCFAPPCHRTPARLRSRATETCGSAAAVPAAAAAAAAPEGEAPAPTPLLAAPAAPAGVRAAGGVAHPAAAAAGPRRLLRLLLLPAAAGTLRVGAVAAGWWESPSHVPPLPLVALPGQLHCQCQRPAASQGAASLVGRHRRLHGVTAAGRGGGGGSSATHRATQKQSAPAIADICHPGINGVQRFGHRTLVRRAQRASGRALHGCRRRDAGSSSSPL